MKKIYIILGFIYVIFLSACSPPPLKYSSINEAAEKGDLDDVKNHIKRGTAINAKDPSGNTPLLNATGGKQQNIAEYLISKGADLNAANNDGITICHSCIINDTPTIFKKIMDSGAKFDVPDAKFGAQPIHYAAYLGKIEYLKILVTRGADINARNKSDETPLYKAIENNHEDIAIYLIEHKADPNIITKNNKTPLVLAVDLSLIKIINMLVVSADDVNIGKAILLAIEKNKPDIMKILINGAKTITYGDIVLRWACEKNNINLVQILINKEVSVNSKSNSEKTALQICAEKGYLEIARLLIDAGADVNAVFIPWARIGDTAYTALIYAIDAGHVDLVKLLLENGADFKFKSHEHSVLYKDPYGHGPAFLEGKDEEAIKIKRKQMISVIEKYAGSGAVKW